MTCIVGIVDRDGVYIGGDSSGVSTESLALQIRADEKVFRNKDFIFGFTTSFRMGQILRYDFVPPIHPPEKSTYHYMVSNFIKGVRNSLRVGGFLCKENLVEKGGTFIVGYRKSLFIIESDFQVAQVVDNFTAVGCGADYAKGVLWELRDSKTRPKEKIRRALKAAEHFSAGVRRPFKIITL